MGPEDNLAKKKASPWRAMSTARSTEDKHQKIEPWPGAILRHATGKKTKSAVTRPVWRREPWENQKRKYLHSKQKTEAFDPALDTELLFLTLEMESATGLNRNWPASKTDEKHLPSTEQWEPKQGSELKSEADRRRPDWKSNMSEPNHQRRLQEVTQKTSPLLTIARPDLNPNVTMKIDQAKQKNTHTLERNQRANNTGSSCANEENNSALTGRTGNPGPVEVTQSLRPENEQDQEILDVTKIYQARIHHTTQIQQKIRGRIKQHTQNARIDFSLHFNEIIPNPRMSPPSLPHLIIEMKMSFWHISTLRSMKWNWEVPRSSILSKALYIGQSKRLNNYYVLRA
jgi:hypothetical protein